MKQKKLIFNFFVNRNWKKLTDSSKRAKILADNRKSHHPIETLRILTSCDYNSSFVPRTKVHRYEGMKMVFESSVFPPDDTQMSNGPGWGSPNRAADSEVIRPVVHNLVAALRLSSTE